MDARSPCRGARWVVPTRRPSSCAEHRVVKQRVCFVVDSGTDVRLADGLAEGTTLRILARKQPSGREISQPSRHALNVETGPAGHAAFAVFVLRRLLALRSDTDFVLVQGY